MEHNRYWQERFELLEESLLRQGLDAYSDMEKQYRLSMNEIEKDITVWYKRLAKNNNISFAAAKSLLNANELKEFRWTVEEYIERGKENAVDQRWIKELENASAKVHISKLEAMKLQTQQHLEVLYGNQLDSLDKTMKNIYSDGYYRGAFEIQKGLGVGYSFQKLDEDRINKVIVKPWAADGRNFSDRVWSNKDKLVNNLHTGLTQATIRGDPLDKMISDISEKMNSSKSAAGRLVMTESAFFASASQRDCFNSLDVEQYEILATLDSKTSPVCREMDGKVFAMSDFKAGITAPPFHCWCRSCMIPYFEDNKGSRAARGKDGKTYHVPADMKYDEWEKFYINEELTPEEWQKSQKNDIIKLQESIHNKHTSILQKEEHRRELTEILDGKNEQILNLYDKISSHIGKSEYYLPNSGAYYPSEKKIRMNMNANNWEQIVGIDRSGAWNTKFHEEFHQLDHLLNDTGFANKTGKTASWAFTDIKTDVGVKMADAITKDIVNIMNQAISEINLNTKEEPPQIKSIGRISTEAKRALYQYLHERFDTPKKRAQIAMFTDAMGLSTQDRLPLFKWGFWGHEAAYNKTRGLNGATSETWASYGAIRMQGHDETEEIMRELMPETFKVYDNVFQELLNYVEGNDLEYNSR